MRIEMDEGYFLKSDARCFIFGKKVIPEETGNEREDVIGYYSTLESALKCIPDRIIMASGATTFKEVFRALKKFRQVIQKAIING